MRSRIVGHTARQKVVMLVIEVLAAMLVTTEVLYAATPVGLPCFRSIVLVGRANANPHIQKLRCGVHPVDESYGFTSS